MVTGYHFPQPGWVCCERLPPGVGKKLETLTQPSGFHPGGSVHGVPKEAVPRHSETHNTCHTGP